MSNLLSNSRTNSKTAKQLDKLKIEGVIQHLTPAKLADGHHTVCPWSTPGCREMCLNTSGRSQIAKAKKVTTPNLQMYRIHRARIGKTRYFLNDRESYLSDLTRELKNLENRAARKGYMPVARLNGTSDIPWEFRFDMEAFDIRFYDYTKGLGRMREFLKGKLPANYDLTFSRSEQTTNAQVREICRKGGNVAVVFRDELPDAYLGIEVINGDEHDFRFLDKKGRIVGLKAKGRAKHDDTGFVVD